jgi:hypothetical protein
VVIPLLRDFHRLGKASICLALGTLVLYYAVPLHAQVKVLEAIIPALAIFVSIFVLFVLSVDPTREYRYLRDGRYHKLAQADKYIGSLGVTSLMVAIVAIGVGASVMEYPNTAGLFSFLVSTVLILTVGAFWLVINYHFGRKHDMTMFLMAQEYLRRLQHLHRPRPERSAATMSGDSSTLDLPDR